MELLELIKARRSVRRYKDIPVKEEDLNTVLEAARWAPSWANTQCWRFVVVREPQTKTKLAEALMPKNPAAMAITNAPIVLVVCAELEKSGFYKGVPTTDKGDWYMFDVALAVQNLILTAESLGLATIHVASMDVKKIAEILDVPANVAVVEMTPLGYADEQPKAPPRKELSELVFYERYNKK